MIQATADRMRHVPDVTPPVVVAGLHQIDDIDRQLTEIGCAPRHLIAEPAGRNTAPAVAIAARLLTPDATMVVLPADHVILDVEAFHEALGAAVEAASDGSLVTFGIVPDRPETGYGYLLARGSGMVRPVERFVEKPDAETAVQYLSHGSYFWNSGMFVFTAEAVLAEMELHAPDVLAAVAASLSGVDLRARLTRPGDPFLASPSISIDYAVMEKSDRVKMVPLDAGWSDVGSWASLFEIGERTSEGNVVVGDVMLHDVHRAYVRSEGRLVAVVGLDDVVVVETADAVLVVARERAQDVKFLVDRFAERPELQ